ncbi:MAG TPA: metallophosphoesterase [Bryobacteraceae bacterium]|nr:metallophosphoesterase [Bryobacteraceae bacterium]
MRRRICLLALLCASVLNAQKFYVYVGDLGPDFVVLAWGTAEGHNTIGRTSPPVGKATVKVGDRTATADQNYLLINGLSPDTEYPYEVSLNGKKIGGAKIRTWPAKSDKLCFFLLGDWGSGKSPQYQIADAMWKEFAKRSGSDNPVRFIATTGDNIYGQLGFTLSFKNSGDSDRDWGPKFFRPYEQILASIPFHPVLGNHDGNETETRGDLAAYLDNFFFPGLTPARYYRFSYGGLADFFALDSTQNTESGPAAPAYRESGDQHKWLMKNLSEAQVPWKIPYFHHPPFNAGPFHPSSAKELAHFIDAFKKAGVKVVFTGHEHNLQVSEVNAATGGIRFLVSGAGGELRAGDVRSAMERSNIAAWTAQLHYLIVEIDKKEMRITPASFQPLNLVDRFNKKFDTPIKVTLP